MSKCKKIIAFMLAFVLCAGTFMSDMGTKEVKAEGITYEIPLLLAVFIR